MRRLRLMCVSFTLLAWAAGCGTADSTSTAAGAAANDGGASGSDSQASNSDSAGGSGSTSANDATTAAGDGINGDATANVDAASEDAPARDPSADATAPAKTTWSSVSAIIKAKCGNCHGGSLFFKATDCASTAKQGAKLASEVSSGKMPQKGSPQLTADEKAAVLKWAADGFSCE